MVLAPREESTLADVLVAAGPNAEHAEALMLFGQFVGAWDVDWAAFDADGAQSAAERGEWVFGWVLEGRAVQDVWIVPRRSLREGSNAGVGEYGTTIRFYDPRLDAWLVTWSGPLNGARRTLVARPSGDEIVQFGRTDDGHPMRWIFSAISEESFIWRSLSSTDGERTWRLREEMHVRRRSG
jgi:hypothetical protein